MSGALPGNSVSPFVSGWIPRVARELGMPAARCRALDLAMGEGRHTWLLAQAGFTTFGADISVDRLAAARARPHDPGLTIHPWACDLDVYPLPAQRFHLLLVSRFLLRSRWADLKRLVVPGGFVLYETFTTGQMAKAYGPSSPEHLLNPGELRNAFAGWHILFSEEVDEPAALARLVARKPDGP